MTIYYANYNNVLENRPDSFYSKAKSAHLSFYLQNRNISMFLIESRQGVILQSGVLSHLSAVWQSKDNRQQEQ